ncbi:hypothetical protein QQG74_06150 [Micromonospora sp. FIMYZ51]|uniref:hypothetical protein n=1 Tax=Micromonospora sp. FIMYZ51 TaxID=3051832 RepID=UPI00311DF915
MQPDGPYRYTHLLGGSPVGKAWAAIDEHGRLVTVAVLDTHVAATPGWREAFAAIADNLAQTPGGVPFIYADFAAAAPWVAYSAEAGPAAENLFRALGVAYQPVPSSAPPVSGAPVSGTPVSGSPVSGIPPVSGAPVSGMPPVSGAPVSGMPPVSGAPHPTSGTSPGAAYPPAEQPAGGSDPFSSPVRRITPSTPRRRPTGRWAAIAALVVVLLVGVGAVVVWAGADEDEPSTPVAGPSSPLPPAPTFAPQSPGIEPPQAGEWPTEWPKFAPGDHVRTLPNLEGLGFAVKLPAEWDCSLGGRAEGYVKYNCGAAEPGKPQLGGELIVRDCAVPCDEETQAAMRQAEEAWGLQWMRGGVFAAYADSSRLEIDGERRYGLAVVAYWRGGESGRIDHQLVLRMTSPIDGAGRLRRVANHLRDTLIF